MIASANTIARDTDASRHHALNHVVHTVIFINTLDSRAGGPQTAIMDLCRALPDFGVKLTVVTLDRGDAPLDSDPQANPRLVDLRHARMRGNLISPSGLRQMREITADADTIHLHGMWELCNLQVAKLARQLGKPYMVTVHGMLDDWCLRQSAMKKNVFLGLAGNKYLRDASCVHTTATGERDQVLRRVRGLNIEILPYLFDEVPFRQRASRDRSNGSRDRAEMTLGLLPTNRQRVLFLSRLHHKKGLHSLVESLSILKQRSTGAGLMPQLLIAGTGDQEYENTIRKMVSEMNLTDDVIFLGHVTGERKFAAFEASDLLAIPTSQENFGLVFVEAMASGLPVLTTKGTDIWPELENAGAKIADGAPEPFADAMASILNEGELLQRRGRIGRQWVMDNLNRRLLGARYRDLYWDIAQCVPELIYDEPSLMERARQMLPRAAY